METAETVKLVGLLLFLPIYGVLGGWLMRWWRRQKPQPAIETDPAAWSSYWLPKLVVSEMWVLVGGAVAWFVFAFIAPTLHGDDERYFILGGGMAFPFFAIFFVGFDVYAVVHARRMARKNGLLANM
jgi:hypothetical protein